MVMTQTTEMSITINTVFTLLCTA